jgi:hypothetical protein
MKIKTSRLNVRKYTFVVRIVEIWNSLPESVIQGKTVKKFEIGLDEHWKHQECKYDFTISDIVFIRLEVKSLESYIIKQQSGYHLRLPMSEGD